MLKQEPEQPPAYEHGQDIRDRALAFACRVVKVCQQLYDAGGVGRLMVPQLMSCSISAASMLEEARAAESDADFISKASISLKECRESWARLRVCEKCRIGPEKEGRDLIREANELIAIITTILRNKRANMKAKARRGVRSARVPNS